MKSKVLYGLLSVVIAFGLWVYVITNVSQEEEMTFTNIPVIYQNESALENHGLMITGGTNQTVSITLSGSRNYLYKLNSSNIMIMVDLSRIYDSGTQSVSYNISFPGDVPEYAMSVLDRPDGITLTVEQKVTKRVRVAVNYGDTTVRDGYLVDFESQELDFQYVTVEGPASVVNQIDRAVIDVDLTDMTQSIGRPFDYTLCNSAGEAVEVPNVEQVVTDVEQIYLTLDIRRAAEIPVRVEIIPGAGATEENSNIAYSVPSILVSGSEEALSQLQSIVLGTIDLSAITEETVLVFPVVLPEGVENESGIEEIAVTVSFPDLMTNTYTLTNLISVNTPAGLEAEILSSQISVTVRGPRTLMENLTADGITVTVDFSGMLIGTTTVRPTITFAPGFTGVGVVRVDNVVIRLQERAPEPEPEPDPEPDSETEQTDQSEDTEQQ